MRCKACDSVLHEPKWNRNLEDWELCPTCLAIALSAFEDAPDDIETEEVSLIEVDEASRFLEIEEGRYFGGP